MIILVNCLGINNSFSQKNLFQTIDAGSSSIEFRNTFSLPDSVDERSMLYLTNGGGVAIGDVNNDGLLDIFFTGNSVSNKLYLNRGGLRFEDVSDEFGISVGSKGWSTGVTMVDINADGWLDIYVCQSQIGGISCENLLFVNNKGRGFTESAKQYGLDISDNCSQASFFDGDNDGDLDAYVVTYPKEGYQSSVYRNDYTGGKDIVLENNDGFFASVKDKIDEIGYGLSCIAADLTGDENPDLYVTNDLLSPDRFYRAPILKRQDHVKKAFSQISFNSMGVDVGDINNDGKLDLITTDMLPELGYRFHVQSFLSKDFQQQLKNRGFHTQYIRNTVQINQGSYFTEEAFKYNVAKTDWSWAVLLNDVNNDGQLDLFISTSLLKDYMDQDLSMFILDSITRSNKSTQANRVFTEIVSGLPDFHLPNKLFVGQNKSGSFVEAQHLVNINTVNTTGCAFGDLDNDGDLDLVLNNLDTTSYILQNLWKENNEVGHFLRLELFNKNGVHALNSVIHVYSGQENRVFELVNSRGFQSHCEPIIHIGVSSMSKIDSLVIFWPSGLVESLEISGLDTLMRIFEGQQNRTTSVPVKEQWLEQIPFANASYNHLENQDYQDFKLNPTLYKRLSRTGPGMAVGDVNGDNIDDIYLCAAKGSSGVLLFGDSTGQFFLGPSQPWNAQSSHEESTALMVDVDEDLDLDLIIVSGGYEHSPNSPWYWDRLFINNGNGFFSQDQSFPKISKSKSCVAACDFDSDGDLDLFLGEHYAPASYPEAVSGHILENENGQFTDVTGTVAPELNGIGLITSSIWSDYDTDGDFDLIVVGEWMSPKVFQNRDGVFTMSNLCSSSSSNLGWWNTIKGADLDNDGDIDYVIGNVGTNLLIQATEERPTRLYYPYLNSDDIPDPILTYWHGETEIVLSKRDQLLDHVNSYRKKFITYRDYASASIESIVGSDAPFLEANELKSAAFINNGNGDFSKVYLPHELQSFPIFGAELFDVNDDGLIDLMCTGNDHSYSNDIGNLDAGGLRIALGVGNGTFKSINSDQTGIHFEGDVKGLVRVKSASNKSLRWVVSTNNGPWRMFKLTSH